MVVNINKATSISVPNRGLFAFGGGNYPVAQFIPDLFNYWTLGYPLLYDFRNTDGMCIVQVDAWGYLECKKS